MSFVFRGLLFVLRRLVFLVLFLLLFAMSAALGNSYRKAPAGTPWQEVFKSTVQSAPEQIAGVSVTLLEAVKMLSTDLQQFAKDISGTPSQGKPKKKLTDIPESSDEDDVAKYPVVAVSLPKEEVPAIDVPEMTVPRLPPVSDPLAWLGGPQNCEAVSRGMIDRYGESLEESRISDPNLREEFRHVFEEICKSNHYQNCAFSWCSGSMEAKEIPQVAPEGPQVRPLPKLPPRTALAKTERISVPRKRAVEPAKDMETKVVVASSISPRKSLIIEPIPSKPDERALAVAEKRTPRIDRLRFSPDVEDEPDEYRLILRQGQASRASLGVSKGQNSER